MIINHQSFLSVVPQHDVDDDSEETERLHESNSGQDEHTDLTISQHGKLHIHSTPF